jgi:hypothetical protein
MQQVLQILGRPHYWEDRASAVKRLAKALPEPALRRQLLMFAEQDRAIAEAMKAYEERLRAD